MISTDVDVNWLPITDGFRVPGMIFIMWGGVAPEVPRGAGITIERISFAGHFFRLAGFFVIKFDFEPIFGFCESGTARIVGLIILYLRNENGELVFRNWVRMTIFIVHIGQSIYIRKYIPSLITSVVCLPISVVILIKSSEYLVFSLPTVLILAGSIALMMVNLRFAHWLMHKFGNQLG